MPSTQSPSQTRGRKPHSRQAGKLDRKAHLNGAAAPPPRLDAESQRTAETEASTTATTEPLPTPASPTASRAEAAAGANDATPRDNPVGNENEEQEQDPEAFDVDGFAMLFTVLLMLAWWGSVITRRRLLGEAVTRLAGAIYFLFVAHVARGGVRPSLQDLSIEDTEVALVMWLCVRMSPFPTVVAGFGVALYHLLLRLLIAFDVPLD
ncbi:MAG: hypothetical protein M1818_002967 [Claussenomyces sp. TS43310]|nr:MAG: hypothetical protein M1818_002967 [Claussenomyces sp. TS43310]